MISDLTVILTRDLDALQREVELYPDDASVWQAVPGCPNPGGTLVLHLVGNLRHFIGAQLGATGYLRARDLEFSTRGVSRQDLIEAIAQTRRDVSSTLAAIDPARLSGQSQMPTGASTPTSLWLLHICAHLAYHLGQLDYHRRAVTGNPAGANAMTLTVLDQSAVSSQQSQSAGQSEVGSRQSSRQNSRQNSRQS